MFMYNRSSCVLTVRWLLCCAQLDHPLLLQLLEAKEAAGDEDILSEWESRSVFNVVVPLTVYAVCGQATTRFEPTWWVCPFMWPATAWPQVNSPASLLGVTARIWKCSNRPCGLWGLFSIFINKRRIIQDNICMMMTGQ